ncbi:MAG: cardiolipin synthase [Hahellaceae bacterium]|nr:cardiolipin synthase [Hahellaceae bacterium]MCP5168360.1 cardiolipin synthase [Hahellaceae bacterium]
MDFNLIAILVFITYALALLCIRKVLLTYRSVQGALAWMVALIAFPFVSLILFALFGRHRFEGYVAARRSGDQELIYISNEIRDSHARYFCAPPAQSPELGVISQLAKMPFSRDNQCDLLIDGEATFGAMFDAIEQAQTYVLLQFYIVRNDRIGNQLHHALLRKQQQGVQVYFLYDAWGSASLPDDYIQALIQSGAKVHPFNTVKRFFSRFQINFRNHRKLVVIDGKVAFMGGINVGDEYLGRDPELSPWRDTQLRLAGPAVYPLQLSFVEDWYWATNDVPRLNWLGRADTEHPQSQGAVLILPTSAADEPETCVLAFLAMINHARKRLWIASPYFVPDLQFMNALHLAALRGVDVRILIPRNADHRWVQYAAYSYLEHAQQAGIRIYRYHSGFMHQKVWLIDDRYCVIGTHNLDNRSMRLNFETAAIVTEPALIESAHRMMQLDFSRSIRLTHKNYQDTPMTFKLLCRASRLLAPLL